MQASTVAIRRRLLDAPLVAVLPTDVARKLRQERFASALLVL